MHHIITTLQKNNIIIIITNHRHNYVHIITKPYIWSTPCSNTSPHLKSSPHNNHLCTPLIHYVIYITAKQYLILYLRPLTSDCNGTVIPKSMHITYVHTFILTLINIAVNCCNKNTKNNISQKSPHNPTISCTTNNNLSQLYHVI